MDCDLPELLEAPWGDGSFPPLLAPPLRRIDEDLSRLVNDGFMRWLATFGFAEAELDYMRRNDIGSYMTLVHPRVQDPGRLLIGAKMIGCQIVGMDDRYADNPHVPAQRVGELMLLSQEAMEPSFLYPEHCQQQLDTNRAADPAIASLRAARDEMAAIATPSQMNRLNHDTVGFMIGCCAEATWRMNGRRPPLWTYLTNRQRNNCIPFLTFIDVLEGYEVPANVFFSTPVRKLCFLVATGTVLVNDLMSHEKDRDAPGHNDLLKVLMTERDCSHEDAVTELVGISNAYLRAFDTAARTVIPDAPAELVRFIHGLYDFIAGGLKFQSGSGRFTQKGPS